MCRWPDSSRRTLRSPLCADHAFTGAVARLEGEQLGSGYAMSSWMERRRFWMRCNHRGLQRHQGRHSSGVSRCRSSRIHVIYNGIDLAEYQKTAETKAWQITALTRRAYVLFVGRITRQKGVTHLVDAISYLPRRRRSCFALERRTLRRSPPNCAIKWRRLARIIRALCGLKRWSQSRRPSSFTATAGLLLPIGL